MKPPPVENGQIVILGVGQNGRREWFRTRVLSASGDIVHIQAPFRHNRPILPEEGQAIDFHTWRAMDARYNVHAVTLSVESRPQAVLVVRMLDAERVQQREYFRVPLHADGIAIRVRPDGRAEELTLKIHDISAGGLRGRSSGPVAIGDELDVRLRLPITDQVVSARARVARIVEPPEGGNGACTFGAAFVRLEARVRELIIQLTLKIQQEWRRRGVL